MVSEKFRRQLRQEVERWQVEALIDATLSERLADRYQFHRLEEEASNRFVAILHGDSLCCPRASCPEPDSTSQSLETCADEWKSTGRDRV
jgi:hypothetical protein